VFAHRPLDAKGLLYTSIYVWCDKHA
jgi:hypothetical protein